MKRAVLMIFVATVAGCLAAAAARATPVSWRERFTLGAGDVLSFRLYGYQDLDRSEIFIRTDGTVGYLQATSVRAEGLTIDELRVAMEKELVRYYAHPRVIITPVQFKSKRYFMLGKVVDRGSFPLDLPLTLIEAVARCRGIETGLFEQNTVELADMPRSFILRGGKRLPVDFQKLFLEGDLSQNVDIEPNDYVFFASAASNEVYVLGQVLSPGVLGFSPQLSVVGAITVRGGFTRGAYRAQVAVVRGGLAKPECHVIDVGAVLSGSRKDFLLQPKDIVYVSERPWRVAEEMVELAVSAFLQTSTAAWTSRNILPVLPEGAVPQLQPPPVIK
jgi:polysaccharide export outer membrane protein